MLRAALNQLCLTALALGGFSAAGVAQDDSVVFKSDVSLVRVDAQVLGSNRRPILGLRMQDFVVRDQGQIREIRNFAREEVPVDVILLIDVSGSMRPHVERIANAAHEALTVLNNKDRVAIMVFDRRTKVRLPFNSDHDDIVRGFNDLLDQEQFNGGTDVTLALLDSIQYMKRNARKDARRAIVILTDDMTERERDTMRVERELASANTVLSTILAPDVMSSRNNRQQYPGAGGRAGGGYPGGNGGPLGGPLGGIILGRRNPNGNSRYPGGGGYPGGGNGGNYPGGNGGNYPGGNYPGGNGGNYPGGNGGNYPGGNYPGGNGGGMRVGGTKRAGSDEISLASGGDTMPVDDPSAFETLLARIRQSYALYFAAPEGARQGESRNIQVALANGAAQRYPDAEVRFRRTYIVDPVGSGPSGVSSSDDVPVTQTRRRGGIFNSDDDKDTTVTSTPSNSRSANDDSDQPKIRRRPAVDDPGTTRSGSTRTTTASDDKQADPAAPQATPPATTGDAPKTGGWRKLKPGEKP